MGDYDTRILVLVESSLEYHPYLTGFLTLYHESGMRTVSGGQFDWGGRLLKSNGGLQRLVQSGWKSLVEYNGIN